MVLLVFIFFPAQPLHQPTATTFCFGLQRISSSDSQQVVRNPERKKSHKIWLKNEMLFLIVFFTFTFPLQPFEGPLFPSSSFLFHPCAWQGSLLHSALSIGAALQNFLLSPDPRQQGSSVGWCSPGKVPPHTKLPSCRAGHVTLLSSRPHRMPLRELLV